MSDRGALKLQPWVAVSPAGIEYLGLHVDEAHTWRVALGWPDDKEIKAHKGRGWYAAPATVSWKGSPRDVGFKVVRAAAAIAADAEQAQGEARG